MAGLRQHDPLVGFGYTAESNVLSTATIPYGVDFGTSYGSNGGGFGRGMMAPQALVASPAAGAAAAGGSGPYNGPYSDRQFLGEPFAVFIGFIILLVAYKWFSERPDTLGGANPAFIRIGGYNLFVVTLCAMVGIISMKLIFNRFKIPGITEFANAL